MSPSSGRGTRASTCPRSRARIAGARERPVETRGKSAGASVPPTPGAGRLWVWLSVCRKRPVLIEEPSGPLLSFQRHKSPRGVSGAGPGPRGRRAAGRHPGPAIFCGGARQDASRRTIGLRLFGLTRAHTFPDEFRAGRRLRKSMRLLHRIPAPPSRSLRSGQVGTYSRTEGTCQEHLSNDISRRLAAPPPRSPIRRPRRRRGSWPAPRRRSRCAGAGGSRWSAGRRGTRGSCGGGWEA